MRHVNELRWDPLSREWIIVAGHRSKRPWREKDSTEKCPFCPGAPEIGSRSDWKVIVLPNKYPALIPNPPEPSIVSSKLMKPSKAQGICEVVIETPSHEGDFDILPLGHVVEYINTLVNEQIKLLKKPFIKYVAIFKNKGREIGVSLTHPHSQIYGLPFIPKKILDEYESFKTYYREHGICLLCDIVREEIATKKHIIYENKYFLILFPFYAKWPYEIHVYSKKHISSLTQLNIEERTHLADTIRVVVSIYNNLFEKEKEIPYIMVFHQKPPEANDNYFHLHLEFYQPYRDKDKKKYAAGIELGFGVFTHDLDPREEIVKLRGTCKRATSFLDEVLGKCY